MIQLVPILLKSIVKHVNRVFKLKPKAKYFLDLREAICPISLLKVTHTFREMKPNETLEILIRDPDTRKDLFKVLSDFSYELINFQEMEEENSFRVQMKKTRNG